jgi:hypothetical protein
MNLFSRSEESKRPVIYGSAPRMSVEEVQSALESLGPNHPAARALLQVLGDHIENAASQVSMPDMAEKPGILAHTAGGLEWLRAAQTELLELVTGKQ